MTKEHRQFQIALGDLHNKVTAFIDKWERDEAVETMRKQWEHLSALLVVNHTVDKIQEKGD